MNWLLIFFSFALSLFDTNEYDLDIEKSIIKWKGSQIIGKEHQGSLKFKNGYFFSNYNDIKKASFVIDMSSLKVLDDDLTDEERNTLETHLKSSDFFEVNKYPSAMIIFNHVQPYQNNILKVTAELSIKGITNTEVFFAKSFYKNGVIIAFANLIIDRTKYNVKYQSKTFFNSLGDMAIKNDLQLEIKLVTKKKSP